MKRFSKTFHTVLKIISFTTEVEMQSFKGIFIQKCSETFLKTNKTRHGKRIFLSIQKYWLSFCHNITIFQYYLVFSNLLWTIFWQIISYYNINALYLILKQQQKFHFEIGSAWIPTVMLQLSNSLNIKKDLPKMSGGIFEW